ncbi:hypothetical protein TW81_05035 [Vibrio galatheae]|uniref:Glycosyl transferase n=1 Tax=Vibrio galatheae TaxID=579748 RepID=A0A0F4NLV6_9VIBR|nr:glycosyltransferase family 2 protein [Vibrio galatheae]KJY84165.1 hypothetical protein TW81_05035 [Vibrio galatheae]
MQKLIVGIVSHGHYDYISSNEELIDIGFIENVEIVVKDNLGDSNLAEYCEINNYTYIASESCLGFGENNNSIFRYALESLDASGSDWFIILNPDVEIKKNDFSTLISELNGALGDFYAPNLFKDVSHSIPENSARLFATYKCLFNPFLGKSINKPYLKERLVDKQTIEWASGAFLCIKFCAFQKVGGFDSKYFMYFEDVDLCYRLREHGIPLRFLKNVKAVHKGEYRNRSIFSKHFRWYLSSLFKFLETQRTG